MKLDDIKKLHQKKYREAFGYFLVEGEHLVLELEKAAARDPAWRASELFVTSDYAHWPSGLRRHEIGKRQMERIAATQTPPGIMALVPIPRRTPATAVAGERCFYLHEIQDPGNLGTVLRTLSWFGNLRALLSPDSVDPYNPKAVRASMGAIFHVQLELDVPLDSLPGRFDRIACLDLQGDSVQSPAFKSFECYVFGNEARGLPRERIAALNAQRFAIPGAGVMESLNLATAAGIVAYELNRR